MMTVDGPRLIEVAARPAGGGHQMVSELATGDNHIKRTVARARTVRVLRLLGRRTSRTPTGSYCLEQLLLPRRFPSRVPLRSIKL